MNQFWNERYIKKEYSYGTKPNQFLAAQLEKITPGKILFPCDGEGRNAVYAALQGWDSLSFDYSEAGIMKAEQLATSNQVSITTLLADATTIEYPEDTFDVIALIYTHFPAEIRTSIHQKIIRWLKPGGQVWLESFNPLQLNNTSGGPKSADMLYTEEMLLVDFKELHTELLETTTTILDEGEYHQGQADIIRFIGTKK